MRLAKLERYPEAEAMFAEELKLFPGSVRAHVGLAMLYQATGRADRAGQVLDDLLRVSPAPQDV